MNTKPTSPETRQRFPQSCLLPRCLEGLAHHGGVPACQHRSLPGGAGHMRICCICWEPTLAAPTCSALGNLEGAELPGALSSLASWCIREGRVGFEDGVTRGRMPGKGRDGHSDSYSVIHLVITGGARGGPELTRSVIGQLAIHSLPPGQACQRSWAQGRAQ